MGTYPEDAGFDSICLWQVDKLGSRFFAPLMYVDGKNVQFEREHYGPTVATDHIINFISENRDDPFFVYYPMILTHSPFVPTPLSKLPNENSKQTNFEDMVHYMDYTIGRISKTITDLGLDQNTLLIFVGDNGTHTTIQSELDNRKVRGGKTKTTNAGTHVPMIAHWPEGLATEPGSITNQTGHLIDFMATFIDVADAKYPNQIGERKVDPLQGKSLLPILSGQQRAGHASLYFHFGTDRAVRQGPWKLVSAKLGRWELYNLKDDRNELNDLSAKYRDRVQSMSTTWFDIAKNVDRLGNNGLKPVRNKLSQLMFRRDTSSGSAQ